MSFQLRPYQQSFINDIRTSDYEGKCLVYKITSPTGRIYIGQTRNLKNRMSKYRHLDCKSQPKLYNSFKRHGVQNHRIDILIICNESDLNKSETEMIIKHKSFLNKHLNCRIEGEFKTASKETRKKISNALKGRIFKEEWKVKLSAATKGRTSPNKGKKMKPESVEKQRQKMIGKMPGEKNPFYGKKHSLETREKFKLRKSFPGGSNPNAKQVLHTPTGVFFDCLVDAANCFNLTYKQAQGRRKKLNPMFVYV